MKIYSIGSGLKEISVNANSVKNNLPIGTVLQFNGYGDHKKVIIENMGVNPNYQSYGSSYNYIDLEDYTTGRCQAYEINHISEKADNRIALYYTDEVLSGDEILHAIEQSKIKAQHVKESAERKAQQRIDETERIKKENPTLIQGEDIITATKNIRIELKRSFPGVKFSIKSKRYSGGNNIDVSWENGPTVEEVEKITQKYQEGNFDGMEDIYNYSNKVWTNVFGGAKYVMENRHISEDVMQSVCKDYVESFGETWTGLSSYYPKCGNEQGWQLAYKALRGCDLKNGYSHVALKDGRVIAEGK